MKSQNLIVLITGGGSGIGLALARKFYDAGNRVILVGRRAEKLAAAKAELEQARGGPPQPGQEIRVFAGDVTEPADIARLVETFPDTNVLVNNAGIQHMYDITTEPPADFAAKIEEEFRVNLIAPVLLTRAFWPQLIRHAGGGSAAIVNVTSGLALAPKASAPTYCASKAGLRSFTKALRYQLNPHKIKVFEVLAPLVDTAMTAGRGSGKISPDQLATEFWRKWRRDQFEMFIGKSKLLNIVNRLAPSLAEKIMRKM